MMRWPIICDDPGLRELEHEDAGQHGQEQQRDAADAGQVAAAM